jgi:hypothetical protein
MAMETDEDKATAKQLRETMELAVTLAESLRQRGYNVYISITYSNPSGRYYEPEVSIKKANFQKANL